jgi:hypothetical protein
LRNETLTTEEEGNQSGGKIIEMGKKNWGIEIVDFLDVK